MLRVFIYTILLILFVRALMKFWNGIMEGVSGAPRPARGGPPQQGVQMVRDPVCGTFVVPASAIAVSVAGERVYFCSDACRRQFLGSPRRDAVGRSA